MTTTGTGIKIGATAFALGVATLGLSPGIAVAESGSDSHSSATADAGKTNSSPAPGPRRGSKAAGTVRRETSPAPAAAAETAPKTQRTPSDSALPEPPTTRTRVRANRTAVQQSAVPAPAQAAAQSPDEPATLPQTSSADPAVPPATGQPAPSPVERPSARASAVCGNCWSFGALAKPPGTQAITAAVHVAQLLDGVNDWLSTLPASPVTEFLSGALLLARRNLFPNIPTIPQVTVGNVEVVEGTDADAHAVFTVALKRAYDSAVTVGYATADGPAVAGFEPGDVIRTAMAGTDYEATSGILTFALGQTSAQVSVRVVGDTATETPEDFELRIFATLSPANPAPADVTTGVVLASGTAVVADDDGHLGRIATNPSFNYGDAMLAAEFSDLAYNHRTADFSTRVAATGWEGIGVSPTSLGPNGFSPAAGGYGVRDGLSLQSYAFAAKRTAADGTEQFVIAFEGSNPPFSEPADWIANAGRYGWSRYYASLEPLMSDVVGQMLDAQGKQQKTQLIITGHSLGGATAMVAYADLLAPKGNLWPKTTDVLASGQRLYDSVGGWSDQTRKAVLDATSVYTFGAPSFLIEPTKLGVAETAALVSSLPASDYLTALALLARAVAAVTVDNTALADLAGLPGINFLSRVFQFEHANSSSLPPYPGDIVSQIGSRDPGTVLQINLDNAIHSDYTTWYTRLVPGGTHPMGSYQESVIRLVSNSKLLKNPNSLQDTSPQLPVTTGLIGTDDHNDFFVNTSGTGLGGNDLYAFGKAGAYTPDGGPGNDTYSISSYDVTLLIDGAAQSGRDTLVFNLGGTPTVTYSTTDPTDRTAVFSLTGSGGKSSNVTITHWDKWQVSDVFQIIKPADGRWTPSLINIDRGPVIAASPAEEIPLSVV